MVDLEDDLPAEDEKPRKGKGWVRRLLGAALGRGDGRDENEAVAHQRPIPPMEGEEDHWVEVSLDKLLTREPDLPVHVVTLRQYRDALGANWDKLGDKVMMLAESYLRRLTRHGAMVTQFEDSFLIAFPPRNRAQGPRLTSDAAIELGQRLVGVKFSIIGQNGPLLGMATVSGRRLLNDGKLDLTSETLAAITQEALPVRAEEVAARPTESVHVERTVTAEAIPPGDMGPENVWRPLPGDVGRQTHEIVMKPIEPPRKKRPEPQWVPLKKD